MQLNKTTKSEEFRNFLNSISFLSNPSGTTDLVSYSFKIPSIEISNLLTSNIAKNKDLFYWKIDSEKIEFAACCPLINFKEYGEDRLVKTNLGISELEKSIITNWEQNNLVNVPMVVGGIKFAPNQKDELWNDYSDSDWFIPKILFYAEGEKTYLVYNFFGNDNNEIHIDEFSEVLNELEYYLNEDIDNKDAEQELIPIEINSFNQWEIIVNDALKNISDGFLSKVVLSREVKYKLVNNPNIVYLLDSLSKRYPNCYTFVFKRKNSYFFGASPEKLARVSDNWIEVDALAGSAPRGKDDIEDVEMEKNLLTSEKNLFEQRAVVYFIHNLLRKFSDEIIFEDHPKIRKLPNIQHLWTEMKAKINDDIKMLDLLMKLHPTPAICGDPWKTAMNFILEKEPHNRGLYSGNVGWFNFNGCGEFAVGIRTALIKEGILNAYAGCGIVEGSEPKAEFEESEIKLKPILSLFVNEKVYQS